MIQKKRSMMKKSFWLFLLGLIFGLNTNVYSAHEGKGEHCKMHSKKSFDEADIDHDGMLDRDEAMAICKKDFALMDKDHDGTVSKEELNACKDKKGKHAHKKSVKSSVKP